MHFRCKKRKRGVVSRSGKFAYRIWQHSSLYPGVQQFTQISWDAVWGDSTYLNIGIGTGFWCCESTVEVLLAVNRCVEICSPRFGKLFFRGWRTWFHFFSAIIPWIYPPKQHILRLWMIPPTAYGIYVFFFTEPVIFSGTVFSWFFNPHLGYLDDKANLANFKLINKIVLSKIKFHNIKKLKYSKKNLFDKIINAKKSSIGLYRLNQFMGPTNFSVVVF